MPSTRRDAGAIAAAAIAFDVRLTPARQRVLEAMASKHPAPAQQTRATDIDRGTVASQAGRWLVEQQLAYYPSGSRWLALTGRGVELVGLMGLMG